MVTKEQIIEGLKNVYDPEIPVNIVDLGFIYDVRIDENRVEVDMTLTTPGCPMHQILTKMAEEAILAVEGIEGAKVNLTFEPRWSVEKITEDGKIKLRGLGYNI
ncbi:DUF59 domain-containing protein [bacterium]|nr:DUF59 domain-containing protein [bacterium]